MTPAKTTPFLEETISKFLMVFPAISFVMINLHVIWFPITDTPLRTQRLLNDSTLSSVCWAGWAVQWAAVSTHRGVINVPVQVV